MGTRDELDRLVRLCVERDVRPVIEAELPLDRRARRVRGAGRRRRLRQARADALSGRVAGDATFPGCSRRRTDGKSTRGQRAPCSSCQQVADELRLVDVERGRVASALNRRRLRAILGAGADVVCAAGGHGPHRPAVGPSTVRSGLHVARDGARRTAAASRTNAGSPCSPRPAARGALARARRALGRARAVLRRRRDRGGQRPLPHRPVARAGQDPHPRGGRGLSARTLGAPARAVRGPEHPAPGARGRHAAHLRARHATDGCGPSAANGGTWPSGRWSRDLGWVDAWRALHGYGSRDASWTFKDDRGGWRLDHVLLDGLTPSAVDLLSRLAPRGSE